jgi:transcriptional regulator with XRE-family HTH domain
MAVIDRGPVVIRRRLGSALKDLRRRTGLHLDVVAKELEVSPAKISRLETGQVAPKLRDVRDLLDLYKVPQTRREELMAWADEARDQGWWQPLTATVPGDIDLSISLEVEARKLRIYSATCVPGLLQTDAYARAVLPRMAPRNTPDQLSRLVQIRLQRQAVLEPDRGRVDPLQLDVILDEGVLRRGSSQDPELPGMMAEQMAQLGRRADAPNVSIRILPHFAGFTEAMSTFSIFEPRDPDDRRVVSVEGTRTTSYLDGDANLSSYEEIWQTLEAGAASAETSRNVLELMIHKWAQGGRDLTITELYDDHA